MDKQSDTLGIIREPIFVMGCSNSGTTILWNALKSHPAICGPPVEGQELDGMPLPMIHFMGKHTFRMWAHYLHEQPPKKGDGDDVPGSRLPYYFTEKNWSIEHQQRIEKTYQPYLKPNARLCDKSPAHTLRARFIQRCFPDATFIGVVRNGYAVAEGIVRKRKFDPERPQFRGLYTEINDAAWQWRKANEVLLSYHNYLNRFTIVRYEDLVLNPKKTLHNLLDFCRLDKDTFQIPILNNQKNREQISQLKNDEMKTITRIAEPMLRQIGYDVI